MATAATADTDAVYQQAVRKLRLLLSASEAASTIGDSLDDEDMIHPFPGSVDHLNNQGLTDPPKMKRMYKRNGKSKARKGLFQQQPQADIDRHSSWHNLVHLDDGKVSGGDEAAAALVRKQEQYIEQLEKETIVKAK